MLRPIVFLDIDDVLCLNTAYTGFDAKDAVRPGGGTPYAKPIPPDLWQRLFAHRPRANLRALDDEFAPRYVVSSSWRTSFSRTEMEIVFRETEIAFVAENLHDVWRTPDYGRGWGCGYRRGEIEEWVERWHHEASPWVALDDFASGASLMGHDNAVLCEPGVGFSDDRLGKARSVLRALGE